MAGTLAILTAISLLLLSWQDLRTRRLPNFLVAVYALTFLLHSITNSLPISELGSHCITASVTFLITMAFFALGWLGGGDVKLWSGVMLWAGPELALPALVIGTVSGGVLGIICWLSQKLLPRLQHTWLRRPLWLLSAERGVPYGVALSIAGLFVLYASR